MLLSEHCKSTSLPEMPFIKMHRASATYEAHDISGTVREFEAYLDLKLYFTENDKYDPYNLKVRILNELQRLTRTNQIAIPGSYWANIVSEADQEEDDGKQVVYVYIITIYLKNWDAC